MASCPQASAPPPSYDQATGGSANLQGPQVPLTYIDFWPVCITPEEKLKRAAFEPFEVLIQKANQWLKQYPNFQLKKCETVLKKVKTLEDIYNGCMNFRAKETREERAIGVFGLRLWLTERTEPNKTAQQIGVTSFMPMSLTPGQFTHVKSALFENLEQTYYRINRQIAQNPLRGKILTVETVFLKIPRAVFKELQGNVNPSQTAWYDDYERVRIGAIRIFFILGEAVVEEIGAADFQPNLLKEPGLLSDAKYTEISDPIDKASEWLKTNQVYGGYRLLNLQTLDVIYHKSQDPHLQSMALFEEKREFQKNAVAFVRVHYAKPRQDVVSPPKDALFAPLSYRTFLPVLTAKNGSKKYFENIHQTMLRVIAWLNAVSAPVVTVETIGHNRKQCFDLKHGADGTVLRHEFYTNSADGEGDAHGPFRHDMLYYIRVYLEGPYTEPPPDRLPPVPEVEDSCNIM